jgi:uncharacterized protein (DUF4415 family)
VPFDHEQMASAMALAPDEAGNDPENPPTEVADWDGAVVSHSLPELRHQLAKRSRGPQKARVKVPTTIRFDADLLEALKGTGKGWQTRVNDALREWAEAQDLLDRASGKR